MNLRRAVDKKSFVILAGGPSGFKDMHTATSADGFVRRTLLVQSAFSLMAHAGLGKSYLPEIAKVIHLPIAELAGATPWENAPKSNLQFHFSQSIVKKGIADISGQAVELSLGEKALIESNLRSLGFYDGPSRLRCKFDF